MAQAEDAIQQIYEDPDLRDELRDDEATLLLTWAEGQIRALAQDTTHFDERFETLRGIVKTINRLAGRRAELDTETRQAKLAELHSAAQTLGASAQAADDLAEALPGMDDRAAVEALTALVAQTTPAQTNVSAASTATASVGEANIVGVGAQLIASTVADNLNPISTENDSPPESQTAVERPSMASDPESASPAAVTDESMLYFPIPGGETLDRTVDFTLPTDQPHLTSGERTTDDETTYHNNEEEDRF